MAVKSVEIVEFLEKREQCPVIDVRAPIEFGKAAMFGAVNVPLFDDEQRAIIGTAYKNQGRDEAIRMGLEMAGPKMRDLVDQVDRLQSDSLPNPREVLVYCARGGMRSESVSWLLDQADFEVTRLTGGYKAYRQFCHQAFDRPWNIVALTGMTGSGKTRLLHELESVGEQVIDLEGMACHRGSAFGGIGQKEQPATELFENLIFEKLLTLDSNKRVWIEDESRSVGRCVIPQSFFEKLHSAPAVYIEVSLAERLDFLIEEYGALPTEDMVAAIKRITKRLGGQNVNAAVEALEGGDIMTCAEILLAYYDKTYGICREKNPRHDVNQVDLTGCDKTERIKRVLAAV